MVHMSLSTWHKPNNFLPFLICTHVDGETCSVLVKLCSINYKPSNRLTWHKLIAFHWLTNLFSPDLPLTSPVRGISSSAPVIFEYSIKFVNNDKDSDDEDGEVIVGCFLCIPWNPYHNRIVKPRIYSPVDMQFIVLVWRQLLMLRSNALQKVI